MLVRIGWLVFLALPLGCSGDASRPVFVGHLITPAGGGESATQGIRLAVKRLSEDHPTGIFVARPLHVRHVEPRARPEGLESQAVRLASLGRVAGIYGGGTLEEVERIDRGRPERLAFPLLTPLAFGKPNFSANVIYLGLRPEAQADALAKKLLEEDKAKHVTLVAQLGMEPYVSIQRAVTQRLESLTLRHLELNDDASNADVLRQKIQESKTDALIVISTGDNLQTLVKAWHAPDAQAAIPLLYAGMDGDCPSLTTPYWTVTAYHREAKEESAQAFRKSYLEMFQTEPDVNAMLAHEGIRMLAHAMSKCDGDLTHTRLHEELKTLKFDLGVAGPVSLNANRQAVRTVYVVCLEAGKVTASKTLTP